MHKEVVKLSEEHPRYGYRFTLAEVRVILESWRVKYNKERLRSSLGYRTPRKFAHRSKIWTPPGLLPPKLEKP